MHVYRIKLTHVDTGKIKYVIVKATDPETARAVAISRQSGHKPGKVEWY